MIKRDTVEHFNLILVFDFLFVSSLLLFHVYIEVHTTRIQVLLPLLYGDAYQATYSAQVFLRIQALISNHKFLFFLEDGNKLQHFRWWHGIRLNARASSFNNATVMWDILLFRAASWCWASLSPFIPMHLTKCHWNILLVRNQHVFAILPWRKSN